MTAPIGRFNAFHEALVADLLAALGLPVEEHFGPFDLDELAAFGAKAPCVRVSITGPSATRPRTGGDREADLIIAAFIVTRATPTRPAHKPAQDIAERLAARIHRKTFGLAFVEPPEEVVIDNLYSGKLRAKSGAGIALFSVSWRQLVIFGTETAPLPEPPPAELPAFEVAIDGEPCDEAVLATGGP